jgi:hypothetical protein
MFINSDPYCYIAAAILALARRDAVSRSTSQDARANRRSAEDFLQHSPFARIIGEWFDCDMMMSRNLRQQTARRFCVEYRFFIELNDETGKRNLTEDKPVVIMGYVQPLKKGKSSVIIVVGPSEFAGQWKAVPVDEWVALDGYTGQAKEMTEKEYAVLLARVPGVSGPCRNAANRRALDSD